MLAGEKADDFDELGAGDVHMDMIADVAENQNMDVHIEADDRRK